VRRKTKIIATLGPASGSRETIDRMVAAGMDVARLNFSHGTYETHERWTRWVREAAEEHRRPVAVLQDIQGPRIRVGTFPGGGIDLESGREVRLLPGDGTGDGEKIFVQHLDAADLGGGDRVLLADGMIEVRVIGVGETGVRGRVVQGGRLLDRKGVAFPGVRLDLPAVTAKDVRDLEFGMELGLDLVAASFVETSTDIRAVRDVVGDTPVIAKIERSAAYENLPDILAVADGAMVARGDLGVELGYESVPRAQREIIRAANAAGRISVTATEMLESMTSSSRPTRAEVTDVVHAVLDGSDAVMLSAETAIGRDPVRTVEVMAAICAEAEKTPGYPAGHVAFIGNQTDLASATAQAVVGTAESLEMEAVVAFTESGGTARLISKYRPRARIIGFTPNMETFRRMAILWGVEPQTFERLESTDEMIAAAERILVERGISEPGDRVAMAAGVPPNRRASTNLLKLHVVP
jgi:pyruvate kinase